MLRVVLMLVLWVLVGCWGLEWAWSIILREGVRLELVLQQGFELAIARYCWLLLCVGFVLSGMRIGVGVVCCVLFAMVCD